MAKISSHEEEWASLGEKVHTLKSKEKQESAVTIEEIRKIIKEVLEVDQRIEGKLREEKNGIHDKLMKIRQGHKALKGYAPKHKRMPRYISKKW